MSAHRASPRCSMEKLVEAHRDGRLRRKEAASVDRHLQSCASCQKLGKELDHLVALGKRHGADDPPSPLEHRRRRLAVLRAAAAPRPAPRAPVGRWAALAVAAVMALVVGGAVWESPELATLQHAELQLAMAQPASPSAVATVNEAPTARYERQASPTMERVRMYAGTLDVAVEPLRDGRRFIVATADAEIEVRGTRFTVRAEDDALREVVVQEGRVEVRMGPQTVVLEAGQSFTVPPADEIEEATPPTPSARSAGRASKDFADALGKLEQGDYAAADRALRAFADAHQGDPREEDADFLAIVALQRASRHAEAAEAARRYLARHPQGARRAEAEAIARRDP